MKTRVWLLSSQRLDISCAYSLDAAVELTLTCRPSLVVLCHRYSTQERLRLQQGLDGLRVSTPILHIDREMCLNPIQFIEECRSQL